MIDRSARTPAPGGSAPGVLDRLPAGIGFVLDKTLAASPNREALVAADRRMSYADLDAAAGSAAAALHRRGLRRGDRLAVSLPNASAIVVLFHAAMRLGLVWVGININLAPPEKRYILEDSGASLLVADPPAVEDLRRSGAIGTVTVSTPQEIISAEAASAEWPRPSDLLDSPAGIAYTSGTTGRPKGVVHSHRNLLLPGAVLVAERGYDGALRRGDCAALTILNLQVTSTLLTAQAGGTQIVMDRVDPVGIAEWIRREQINSWFGVPTMLHGLATNDDVRETDLSSLEDIWTGGADLPESIREIFEGKFKRPVHATYGLTEVPTVVSIEPRRTPHRQRSSGRVLPHLEVHLITDRSEGATNTGAGEGEIVIRGRNDGEWADTYTPMLGYHNDPSRSAEALSDGFLHTGDVGRLESDGSLSIRGRRTTLILRGGSNVYPAEIERVLLEVPGVIGAAVVGFPDERLGQRVGAAVEVASDVEDTLLVGHLERWCRSSLARYKVPERWLFRTLPRNAMGKVVTPMVESWFVEEDPNSPGG